MLDNKDLELLRSMMQEVVGEAVSASEARMTAKIDSSIAASEARMTAKIESSIAESEARMTAKMTAKIDSSIAASEARMTAEIRATESKIMGYIESAVMPKFDILAEGHKLLTETLAPKSRVDELEEEINFLKPLVMSMLTDIDKLKKAQ